jgi:hypothetical protein
MILFNFFVQTMSSQKQIDKDSEGAEMGSLSFNLFTWMTSWFLCGAGGRFHCIVQPY